jgi:RNA polymerase sigma-70 factor, ECF subfamily
MNEQLRGWRALGRRSEQADAAESDGLPVADWRSVYDADLPRVYNFFRYRVGDGPLAEDLTAATFERAWRGRHRYRHDLAAFSTWLFGIARRVAAEHFRRTKREVSLEQIGEIADTFSTEAAVQQRRDFEALTTLLMQLPDRDRELIALKYGAGLTNRAIANVTGLTESNVGTILHRVVRHLRTEWEDEADE